MSDNVCINKFFLACVCWWSHISTHGHPNRSKNINNSNEYLLFSTIFYPLEPLLGSSKYWRLSLFSEHRCASRDPTETTRLDSLIAFSLSWTPTNFLIVADRIIPLYLSIPNPTWSLLILIVSSIGSRVLCTPEFSSSAVDLLFNNWRIKCSFLLYRYSLMGGYINCIKKTCWLALSIDTTTFFYEDSSCESSLSPVLPRFIPSRP